MLGVYSFILLLFMSNILRIYHINISGVAAASDIKGSYSLDVVKTRGMIYDRNMTELVGADYGYVAAVMPTIQAAAALMPLAESEEERQSLEAKLRENMPFIMPVENNNIYAYGVDIFKKSYRYTEKQIAPHVLGYLSGDGLRGVAGIEKAYDEFLDKNGTEIKVKYQTDAVGHFMKGAYTDVEKLGADDTKAGVVLTLDREVQEIAENAVKSGCDSGAVVVMDIFSGDILAMVSIPDFDQNNISASFERNDAPFINRAASGYNIGSVFKVIVSAAALEYGVPESFGYYCNGSIEIGGRMFNCNNNAVHGTVDMEQALKVSCNTYFITLAKEIPSEHLSLMAKNMGLGAFIELAPGMFTQSGNIPDNTELANELAYANFSFGQGSSLASPLQISQAVAAIANSGMTVIPRLVKGFTLDGVELAEQVPVYTPNRIMRESTAQKTKSLMELVVEEGSGKPAKPFYGGAGGKTSSAQTGQVVDGNEIVHAWFAGFYPAKSPRYSITVFVEGGESGERVAAPIFRQIADGISNIAAEESQAGK